MSITGALIAALIGAVIVLFFWARDNDRQIEVLARANGQRLQDHVQLRVRVEALEGSGDEEPPAAPLCSVCNEAAQPKLTINLQPVCTSCVRSGRAFNKEKA